MVLSIGRSAFRGFSGSTSGMDEERTKKSEEVHGEEDHHANEKEDGSDASTMSEEIASLRVQLEKRDSELAEMAIKVKDTENKSLRILADMENLRERTARQAENVAKFGIQSFAKGIVGVIDTFERAVESVPQDLLEVESKGEEETRLRKVLQSFHEGIKMTEKQLLHVLKENGVERFDPTGEKFDPNLHQAMFELEDPDKEVGTIAIVTKKGYMLHDRVMRPADVGVVKAKTE